MEEIEKNHLMEGFNNWVKKLPPEHRSQAYKFAESFLCVGAMHGAIVGTMGTIATLTGNPPKKSEGDKQKEFIAYLQKKAKENETLTVEI